jgi:hypothetical protein
MLDDLAPAHGSKKRKEKLKYSYPKLDQVREEECDHPDD